MTAGWSDPEPLAGGFSGETFVAQAAGERVVVRIYAGRSASRGPDAPEIDAAVLRWVAGVVPVARVLEAVPGDPALDRPGVLVTSFLPGVLLEDLLPTLDRVDRSRVGAALGTLLGRLAHVALPRPGVFADRDLRIAPFPPAYDGLAGAVSAHADRLGLTEAELAGLRGVADHADRLLDTETRVCLVHSDLNPKNVLVDPETLQVTGLLDWEFAHAGSPHADLGNLLRFHREPAFAEAVLATRAAFVPDPRPDALDLACAADLYALLDLAARREDNVVARRAHELLREIARSGDPGATLGEGY